MAMKIQFVVFWVVVPGVVVYGYQRFGGRPKRWYPSKTLHGVTTQKTTNSLSRFKIIL
jgi:hypothetical protein